MSTKLIAVDRLGSGVWLSDSYQIFALTAGGCPRKEGKFSGGRNVRGGYVRGGCTGGNVLRSAVWPCCLTVVDACMGWDLGTDRDGYSQH